MERYDESDTFEKVESWPTTKVETWPTMEEIERRLRRLGCTKEQVRRHLDQVAMSRIEAAREKAKPRSKGR
jgi:hypothetical protein